MKTLLVVFHTGGVKTAQMAEAVERGARTEAGVRVLVKRCAEAGPEDVLAADGLILGTPENFGYMARSKAGPGRCSSAPGRTARAR